MSDQKYVKEVQGDVIDNVLNEYDIDDVLLDEEIEEFEPIDNIDDDAKMDDHFNAGFELDE